MLGAALITKLKFKFYSCQCSMNSGSKEKSFSAGFKIPVAKLLGDALSCVSPGAGN